VYQIIKIPASQQKKIYIYILRIATMVLTQKGKKQSTETVREEAERVH
jgi:hypothetical protein